MTLTFDLVTLTLGQLQRLININNICKYHQDPSIRQTLRQTLRHKDGQTDRQTDRRTDRVAHRVALQLMLAAQLKTKRLRTGHVPGFVSAEDKQRHAIQDAHRQVVVCTVCGLLDIRSVDRVYPHCTMEEKESA